MYPNLYICMAVNVNCALSKLSFFFPNTIWEFVYSYCISDCFQCTCLVLSNMKCYLHTVDKISNLKIVLLLRAKNNQNCSFCDKSQKRPRITNVYKINIFWYGAIPNLHLGPSYLHVKKWHIRPLHGNEAELKYLFLSLLRITLPRCLAFHCNSNLLSIWKSNNMSRDHHFQGTITDLPAPDKGKSGDPWKKIWRFYKK